MTAFVYSFFPPLRQNASAHAVGQKTRYNRYVTLRAKRPFMHTSKHNKQPYRNTRTAPTTAYSIVTTAKYGEEEKENLEGGALPSWQFAYIITTLITALTGGRALAAISTVFYLIGRVADSPTWLITLSTVFVTALTDALIFRISHISADGNVFTPFAIFMAGNVAAAVLDFDSYFQSMTPGTPNMFTSESAEEVAPTIEGIVHEDDHGGDGNGRNDGGTQTGSQFSKWDKQMERKDPLNGE